MKSLVDIIAVFSQWMVCKIEHHVKGVEKEFFFREKEVWWAALGKNIGYEVDGKHQLFERPVLIIKKYSKDMCFVLPLTTQIKNPAPWYQYIFEEDGKMNAVNMSQGRTISSGRLLRKKSIVQESIFVALVNKFISQFEAK